MTVSWAGPWGPWHSLGSSGPSDGVLIATQAGGTHLEGDLQVDLFSHLADVGLTEVAGDADPGGLCMKARPRLSAQWGC